MELANLKSHIGVRLSHLMPAVMEQAFKACVACCWPQQMWCYKWQCMDTEVSEPMGEGNDDVTWCLIVLTS